MDINKDGKSDLVRVWTSLYQYDWFWDPKDIDSKWTVETWINNVGLNNKFNLEYRSPSEHANNDSSRPIPLVSSNKYRGLDSDLLMIRFAPGDGFDKTITYIDFKKNFADDNLISKVTQSNGAIVDEIFYKPMLPTETNDGLGIVSDFYSSSEELQYPLIELKQ